MSDRGRGNPFFKGRKNSPYRGQPSNRGRVIAQIGQQTLIAENIASSSSTNTSDDSYKEFLEWKAARQSNTGQSNLSYANIVNEDDSDIDNDLYEQNNNTEVILLIEDKDLKWKDDIWHLLQRYLNTSYFTAESYKPRLHYETILKNTHSCEISHFYAGRQTQVYSFSKIIIKQIISAEDWGMSTQIEKEYLRPDTKAQMKYNYWDYIQAFNKTFLYENNLKKHTWFIKICATNYTRDIPNWLYQWWVSFGPTINILPEPYKSLYTEWVEVSPALIEAQNKGNWIEGMPSVHFFIEFSIPWIWKWEPELGHTQQNIPCIKRTFYTKFWKKMLRKNEKGLIEGQETLDLIRSTIEDYKEQIELHQQYESPSPFQQLSRKIKFKKGDVSTKELLASYMEEVKKDLIKNLGCTNKSDVSMASSSHEGEEFCLPGEAQPPYEEEADISIEEMVETVQKFINGEINGSNIRQKKSDSK